jgi:hypothetical protein
MDQTASPIWRFDPAARMARRDTTVHVIGMNSATSPITIQTAPALGGVMTYLVSVSPDLLPPVSPRELELAWEAARSAAIAETGGPALLFRFLRGKDEAPLDMTLTDNDARCWAEAVDAARGLNTPAGMSLCLRLLALIDLIARERWAAGHVALRRDGAEIDAALLRAAAELALNREARFDAAKLRARLSRNPLLKSMVPRESTNPTSRP